MRKSTTLMSALAIAGLAIAGGSAFTAGGVKTTAAANQFIGGTVSQIVSGATLQDVNYTFVDTTNREITTVTLTFVGDYDLGGYTPVIAFTGAQAGVYTCVALPAAPAAFVSVCSASSNAKDVTKLDVSLPDAPVQ